MGSGGCYLIKYQIYPYHKILIPFGMEYTWFCLSKYNLNTHLAIIIIKYEYNIETIWEKISF